MKCSFSPNILVIYLEELLSLYYYIKLEYKFNKDQQKRIAITKFMLK